MFRVVVFSATGRITTCCYKTTTESAVELISDDVAFRSDLITFQHFCGLRVILSKFLIATFLDFCFRGTVKLQRVMALTKRILWLLIQVNKRGLEAHYTLYIKTIQLGTLGTSQ